MYGQVEEQIKNDELIETLIEMVANETLNTRIPVEVVPVYKNKLLRYMDGEEVTDQGFSAEIIASRNEKIEKAALLKDLYKKAWLMVQ